MQLALFQSEITHMRIIHKFEAAGLGLAPFKCVGMSEERCSDQPDSRGITVGYPGQPCGTCAYCGQGIAYCYQILSADGKRFIVGSDCVNKTSDTGLIDLVKRKENQRKTAQRHITEARKIAEAEPAILKAIAAGRSKPHPDEQWAARGQSLGDQIEWLWKNSGNAGKLALIKKWCK